MSDADDIGYTARDWQIIRDRVVEYMCKKIQGGRNSFPMYELLLQSKIGAFHGNESELKKGILENVGTYEIIMDRLREKLMNEDLLVPTDDPRIFAATSNLRKLCRNGFTSSL